MPDEEIRTDEEPEVEGHKVRPDKLEGESSEAQSHDSDDVEAHRFMVDMAEKVKPDMAEKVKP